MSGGFRVAWIAALLVLLPLTAIAQNDLASSRATALERSGRCAEALDVLAGVGEPTPADHFLRGRCHMQLAQYPAAENELRLAREAAPGLPHVDLYYGMAAFHLGDIAAAETSLAKARAGSADRAELYLYEGLLALRRQENAAAAASLERARAMSATVEPTASYYAGLAFAGSDDAEQAIEALDRVIAMEPPDSDWAKEARRAKQRLQATESGAWWASAKFGVEYDDNVVLRSKGGTLPQGISGSQDTRAVWVLHGGYEFLRERDWSAGVALTYYGSAHFDLEEFNEQNPVLSLWVDRRLAEATTLRLRYDSSYAWIDGKPFQASNTLTPSVFHEWGTAGRSEAYASIYKYNYLYGHYGEVPDGRGQPFSRCLSPGTLFCSPPGVNEGGTRNQDGLGVTAGFDHSIPLGFLETELTAGYRYDRYSSRGSEYSYQGHEFRLETESRLPLEFQLRTLVSYTLRPYRNNSSFPDPQDVFFNLEYPLQNENRRDDAWYVAVELEKKLTDQFSAEIAYRYIKNHSNVAVFDYDRKILGFYVTYSLEQ